jgi:hypothetical protein
MTTDTRQLDDMREAAYGLGMAFARAAEAEGDLDRKLQLFDAFHRSFASVRLSIALAMRLRREAQAPARVETERDERDEERDEALERSDAPERAERYDERDRDRESERASLPLLLRTLERVADDAQALMPQAAELPTLRELLDRVRAEPAAPAPPAAPPSSGALRTRLSGGTAALTLLPKSGPSGLPGRPGAPSRRSTGPP